MPNIQQLPTHVADLIAAGEVVERPASVVKELVENALDAGANVIGIDIENGGLTYIRVSDNGHGMDTVDAETACLRHATSKLRTGRDLEAIGTLGFRGEALAAIAAVTRVELVTRRADCAEGTRVVLDAGQIVISESVGCPVGTTFTVRDLCFNTPARRRFMKSDRAEAAAITALVQRLALSRPDVSFRYRKDDAELYHTPGDGKVQSAIYTLLGRDFANGLLEVIAADAPISVAGFVTRSDKGRGNRGGQYFFINGRTVRSALLQAALEQAYKNEQFVGRFPGCVLYLTMGLGVVDVNIHPTKDQVKFLHDKEVFDAVHYSVRSALNATLEMPELTLSRDTCRALNTTQILPPQTPIAAPSAPTCSVPPGALSDTRLTYQAGIAQSVQMPTPAPVAAQAESPPMPIAPRPESASQSSSALHRLIGEALQMYIIAEQGENLLFIDKHAAHERLIFDRLQAADYTPMPQQLLTPQIPALGAVLTAVLLEHKAALEAYGFEIDAFGHDTVALRAVPGEIDLDDVDGFLSDLLTAISTGRGHSRRDTRDEILHTLACKAAIKAGKKTDATELAVLVDAVIAGDVKYCPHGRPVSLLLTKAQLDKQIKRG